MDKNFGNRFFGNERKYVNEVLDSEFRGSKNCHMTAKLEAEFSKRFGTKYAISFVNGTATMHAALEALGVGPGDEVIVPSLTMSATTFAVLQANATPVFADIDPDTFEVSATSIEKLITPNTRAIITVALYGMCPDMDHIMLIANKHNLFVIEDNAECFLGKYKGRLVGTIGHCSSFSFQSSKHLTSGEGGILLVNDLEFANRVRKVQCLGYASVGASESRVSKKDIQNPNYSRHTTMGWNYRMPELCSAVALAQLENIDQLVNRRIEAASIFSDVIDDCDWLIKQVTPDNCTHSYWTWVIRLDHPQISWHEFRDKFISLGGDGIYAAWKLSYLEPMFQKSDLLGRDRFISSDNIKSYAPGLCPVAERIQPQLLQFKTNYWSLDLAYKQAKILKKTIDSF